MAPPEYAIAAALRAAGKSLCRSKRGVCVYDPASERGCSGFNGPPPGFSCPGRELCTGTCGKRCVHAEMRALRGVDPWPNRYRQLELVHVELAADGGVVACDGPSCWQCSREILDVGFISGVWLFEQDYNLEIPTPSGETWPALKAAPHWRRYDAAEFHRVTLERCDMVP